jgi:hypothetical protein
MHIGAAICFVVAILLYAATSSGAIAFGLLGACFEALGWYQLFASQKKRRQDEGNQ